MNIVAVYSVCGREIAEVVTVGKKDEFISFPRLRMALTRGIFVVDGSIIKVTPEWFQICPSKVKAAALAKQMNNQAQSNGCLFEYTEISVEEAEMLSAWESNKMAQVSNHLQVKKTA